MNCRWRSSGAFRKVTHCICTTRLRTSQNQSTALPVTSDAPSIQDNLLERSGPKERKKSTESERRDDGVFIGHFFLIPWAGSTRMQISPRSSGQDETKWQKGVSVA